ncbi:MAG: hypothetical protein H6613_17790 [Ignavibacteriales bacterium]|nr:hypothetical protein [Ignavibacteriales bacterium]
MIGELNCNSGDFVGTISNLGNHTEIYANMEIAGISIHSKDFKIGDTTPGVTGKPCPGIPTLTYEGKTYNTVQIGNQCWLKENLDIGTMINGSVSQTDNNITEKYCYNDDISNCNTFGGLYQWNEAMKYSTTEGTKGICPDDWHIPTYADLLILYESVEISDNALEAGSNTSGFSALLAGTYYDGFYGLGNETHIWNSSELNSLSAHALYISPKNILPV